MKNWLTLILVAITLCTGYSQHRLDGLYEGTMTRGGIYSSEGLRFELLLEVKGGEVKGRSYIHIGENEIIEMDIQGKLYNDRSIYFEDIKFVSQTASEIIPPFSRKYQLVFNRSIWDSTLEGYWQEIRSEVFHEKRKRGRISLKKVGGSKA